MNACQGHEMCAKVSIKQQIIVVKGNLNIGIGNDLLLKQ